MVVGGCWEILLRFVKYDMWLILGVKKLPLEEDYLKKLRLFLAILCNYVLSIVF